MVQPNCCQPLQERPDAGLKFRIVRGCGQEHADAPHPLGLLRARRERPRRRRAAEQRDELAPPHGEHGGSLPGAAADHTQLGTAKVQAVWRIRSLPGKGQPVLGADLSCSEEMTENLGPPRIRQHLARLEQIVDGRRQSQRVARYCLKVRP